MADLNSVLLTIIAGLLGINTALAIYFIKTIISHGKLISTIITRCEIFHPSGGSKKCQEN